MRYNELMRPSLSIDAFGENYLDKDELTRDTDVLKDSLINAALNQKLSGEDCLNDNVHYYSQQYLHKVRSYIKG